QQVFKHVPEPMGIAGHFVGQRRIHQAKNSRPPLRLGIGYKVDRLLDQGSEGELDSLDAEFFEFHAQNLGLSIVSANSTKWGSIPPNFRGSGSGFSSLLRERRPPGLFPDSLVAIHPAVADVDHTMSVHGDVRLVR